MAKPDGKLHRSWLLLACSFRIIAQNKRLLLFPLLSLCCAAGIAGIFMLAAALISTGQSWTDPQHWRAIFNGMATQPAEFVRTVFEHSMGIFKRLADLDLNSTTSKVAVYGYGAVFYLAMMVTATFWNVAFYHEILKALAGEKVSLGEGLKFASRRIRAILLWSLFAGAVGLVIREVSQRFGVVGRLVLSFVGMAWSVSAVFVIPVMVREESPNPITLLKNSAATLKKTWGETLIGFVGIGFVNFGASAVVFGAIMLLLAGGVLALWLDYIELMVVAFALLFLALVILGYVVAAASDVYRCALYVYATEGVVPLPYTTDLMDAAWKVTKT